MYTDNPEADADAYLHQCDMRQAMKDEFINGHIFGLWLDSINPKEALKITDHWINEQDEMLSEIMEITADMKRAIETGVYDQDAALKELGRKMIAFFNGKFKELAEEAWENKL